MATTDDTVTEKKKVKLVVLCLGISTCQFGEFSGD